MSYHILLGIPKGDPDCKYECFYGDHLKSQVAIEMRTATEHSCISMVEIKDNSPGCIQNMVDVYNGEA